MAMSREERGNIVIAGGASSANVTFTNAFKAATVPDIAERNKISNISHYFSNITNTGFTINLGSAVGTGGETWRYIATGIDT